MTLLDYLSLLPKPLSGVDNSQIRRIKNGYLPDLDDSVVQKAANSLGLDFLSVEGSDNLCFIQSSEVQPSFRTSFNWRQLLDVIYATHTKLSIEDKNPSGLYLPATAEAFWSLEAMGQELRQLHLLQFPLPSGAFFPHQKGSTSHTGQLSRNHPSKATRTIEIGSDQAITGVPEEIWTFSLNNRLPAQMAHQRFYPLSQDDLLTYRKILLAIRRTIELNKHLSSLKVHLLQ